MTRKTTTSKAKVSETVTAPSTVKEKKEGYERLKRPEIPAQMQRELWARAAGRCQFGSCNKLLYRDEVTKEAHNGATIAHIVAYSPKGPRGHATRSKKLEKHISNLMLTCKTHGSHIDDKSLVDQYPEARLLEFKRDHETRVRNATAALDDHKTTLLILQGAVSGTRVEITLEEARTAISPRWPDSEAPFLIDLNDQALQEGHEAYWQMGSAKIRQDVAGLLRRPAGQPAPQHLSIFAIAPIPLLVLLGAEVGSRMGADLYQKQRRKTKDPWCWDEGEPDADHDLEVHAQNGTVEGAEDAAIVVSMTSLVDREAVTQAIGKPHILYELRAHKPGADFLKHRSQLTTFGNELRKILQTIRDEHRAIKRLHFILACPAPVAIDAGRNLIEKADPEVLVYEYSRPDYRAVITLNSKAGGHE